MNTKNCCFVVLACRTRTTLNWATASSDGRKVTLRDPLQLLRYQGLRKAVIQRTTRRPRPPFAGAIDAPIVGFMPADDGELLVSHGAEIHRYGTSLEDADKVAGLDSLVGDVGTARVLYVHAGSYEGEHDQGAGFSTNCVQDSPLDGEFPAAAGDSREVRGGFPVNEVE